MYTNEQDIRFEHVVVFEDNQVYARAREQESRRVRLFLINEQTGDVYSRNRGSWEEIYGDIRSFVVNKIYSARHAQSIPVYNLPRTSFAATFSA
jgi:hypothetical protein